jgi:hypothetical protein
MHVHIKINERKIESMIVDKLLAGFALGVCAFALSNDVYADVAVVKSGAPIADVVLPENPTKVESFAAAELSRYVERATGARLSVVRLRTPGKPSVLIGRASGLAGFAPNEFRVKVDGDDLLLAGGDAGFFCGFLRGITGFPRFFYLRFCRGILR